MKEIALALLPFVASLVVALTAWAMRMRPFRTGADWQTEVLLEEIALAEKFDAGTDARAIMDDHVLTGVVRYVHDAKWSSRNRLHDVGMTLFTLKVALVLMGVAGVAQAVISFGTDLNPELIKSVQGLRHGAYLTTYLVMGQAVLAVVGMALSDRADPPWKSRVEPTVWASVQSRLADIPDLPTTPEPESLQETAARLRKKVRLRSRP